MKKQSGITLIALVVTIIVLLILTTISISTVVGKKGLLAKADFAVSAAKEAQAKDEMTAAWTKAKTKYYGDMTNNADKELQEFSTKAVLDSYLPNGFVIGNPIYRDNVYKVKYQTEGKVYTITFDEDDAPRVLTVTNPLDGIPAETVASAPSEYYDKTVNYSVNGITGWKIFYADEDNIFLITSDFMLKTKLLTWDLQIVTSGSGIYNSFWATNNPSAQQVNDSLRSSFMWNRFPDYSRYRNCACISRMLKTENWRNLVDLNYADYAIGGPTIEMYCASWNALYPTEKIYCDVLGNTGYKARTDDRAAGIEIPASEMQTKVGFTNPLFYPHAISDTSNQGYEGTSHYRLASPSAYSEWKIWAVYNGGALSGTPSFDNAWGTFRPLVRLKANITLKPGTDGYDYTLKIN